jgi:hypothetical protein
VHDCAEKVHLNPKIIERSKQIERGLQVEGRKIKASLSLEEEILKPLVRELLEKFVLLPSRK